MFNKDKNKIANEKILYEAQPNFIMSCKNIFISLVILGVLFSIYTAGVQYIGGMQVYLISSVNLPLTRYFAIAMFILIIFVFAYIVWQLLIWNSTKYIITDHRVITKKGIINENRSYMSYNTIQDINVSQSILDKIFSVGTLSLYSAYDGKNLELTKVSGANNIEEIIFENMNNFRHSNFDNLGERDSSGHNPTNLFYGSNDTPDNYSNKQTNYYNQKPLNSYNSYDQQDLNFDREHEYNNSQQNTVHYNSVNDLDDLELIDAKQRKKEIKKAKYNSRNIRRNKSNNPKYFNQNNQYVPNPNLNNVGKNYSNPNLNNMGKNYSNQDYNLNHEINPANRVSDDSNYYGHPNSHDSIRESYNHNPEKYFGENYDQFHETNLRNNDSRTYIDNSDDYGKYVVEDNEFDNTVNQAMRNLDEDIKFKHNNPQRVTNNPNTYDKRVGNDLNYEGHSFVERNQNYNNDQYINQTESFNNPSEEYNSYEVHDNKYDYPNDNRNYNNSSQHYDDNFTELNERHNPRNYGSNSQSEEFYDSKDYNQNSQPEEFYNPNIRSNTREHDDFNKNLNDKEISKKSNISSLSEKDVDSVLKKHSQKFKR